MHLGAVLVSLFLLPWHEAVATALRSTHKACRHKQGCHSDIKLTLTALRAPTKASFTVHTHHRLHAHTPTKEVSCLFFASEPHHHGSIPPYHAPTCLVKQTLSCMGRGADGKGAALTAPSHLHLSMSAALKAHSCASVQRDLKRSQV